MGDRTSALLLRGLPLRLRSPGCYTPNLVYRQVVEVPWILHFEPTLDAFSLRSDVISSIKNLSLWQIWSIVGLKLMLLPLLMSLFEGLAYHRTKVPPLPDFERIWHA